MRDFSEPSDTSRISKSHPIWDVAPPTEYEPKSSANMHPIQFGTKTFMKKDPQIPALRRLSIDKAGELALEIEGVGQWAVLLSAQRLNVGAQA
jgi:hypothetical protein